MKRSDLPSTGWQSELRAGCAAVLRRLARQPAVRLAREAWLRLLDEAGALLAPVVDRWGSQTRLVAVPIREGGFAFHRVVRGRTCVLGPDDPVGNLERVELRLRSDQVLLRSLTFPAASRDFLGAIVEHRLDRLTPWRRDAVMHGFAIEGTSQDGATITVRVLASSTEIADPLLVSLQSRGLIPIAVGAQAEAPEKPLPIVLGRGPAARHRPAWLLAAGRVWLGITASLAVAAVGIMLWASVSNDRETEAERHLVKARRLVRTAATGASDTAEASLLAAKRPDAAAVVLIDRLAGALPDSAYLRELALTPGDLRLAGTAADAPALIPLLQGMGLANVRFTSPVARTADRRDSFEITADRPPPAEAAP